MSLRDHRLRQQIAAVARRARPDDVGEYYRQLPHDQPPEILVSGSQDRWFKASANWSKASDGNPHGLCRAKGYEGTGPDDADPDDTEQTIYLWCPRKLGTPNAVRYAPNVWEDMWFRVREGSDGLLYGVPGDVLDAAFGWCMEWDGSSFSASEIPPGWQLRDSSNDPQGNPVPDRRGRFRAEYYSGGVPASSILGDEGDYSTAWANQSFEYNRTLTHAQHRHSLNQCIYGTSGSYEVAFTTYTGYETQDPHEDVDIRPPAYTGVVLIRVDNSVTWVAPS